MKRKKQCWREHCFLFCLCSRGRKTLENNYQGLTTLATKKDYGEPLDELA